MNGQLTLIGGGIVLVVILLVGAFWGWVTALAWLIGIALFTCIVLGRYALLKLYLKTYTLRTVLYTNPISAMLYSAIDPHQRYQTQEPDDLFPSQKIQEPEELPPFDFTEVTEEAHLR